MVLFKWLSPGLNDRKFLLSLSYAFFNHQCFSLDAVSCVSASPALLAVDPISRSSDANLPIHHCGIHADWCPHCKFNRIRNFTLVDGQECCVDECFIFSSPERDLVRIHVTMHRNLLGHFRYHRLSTLHLGNVFTISSRDGDWRHYFWCLFRW